MIDPPSAELLEARHVMVVAAAVIGLPALAGGIAAFFWARSQRRKPAMARRGPLPLIRILQLADGAQTEPGKTTSMGWRGAIVLLAVLLYFFNMFVFFVFSTWIGGDATAGQITNGRFFVSSHGHLTEVCEAVFYVSLWHTRSVWLTSALFFGIAAILGVQERFGKAR